MAGIVGMAEQITLQAAAAVERGDRAGASTVLLNALLTEVTIFAEQLHQLETVLAAVRMSLRVYLARQLVNNPESITHTELTPQQGPGRKLQIVARAADPAIEEVVAAYERVAVVNAAAVERAIDPIVDGTFDDAPAALAEIRGLSHQLQEAIKRPLALLNWMKTGRQGALQLPGRANR